MSTTRRYLGWDRPFCQVFAEDLKGIVRREEALDECLVWMPSARAGRHFLNELFSREDGRPEGIHPPMITTPARFIRSLQEQRPGLANELQCLLAWKRVLCALQPSEVAALFPFIPEGNRNAWGFSIGQQLMQLKRRLGEENQSISGIAGRIQSTDRDRWEALGRLESAYRRILEEQALLDPDEYLSHKPERLLRNLPYRRVLVGGVLNLSPRQIRFLQGLERMGCSVDLCLPVPPERAESLDEWGRPLPGKWNTEPVPGELLEERLHRSFEPRELVGRVLELAEGYVDDTDALVVCSPAEDLADYLVERSRLSKTPFYPPVGKPLGQTGFGRLLLMAERIFHDGRLTDIADLLKNELFREWVVKAGLDPSQVESDLLGVQQDHFLHHVHDLSDPQLLPIRGAGRIRELFTRMQALFEPEPAGVTLPDRIWNGLQTIAASNDLDEESRTVLGQLEERLAEIKCEMDGGSASDADCWELLRYSLESTIYYPEREADQRPVTGWLELPWETAPHLVVLGLPDAEVPGGLGMGPFLSPGVCKEAGLRSPEMEIAFHACRFRMILESRREDGRVDILLPERGLDDYPSQSSRFLFLAPEEELLSRVKRLLESKAPSEIHLPASFGCRIRLPSAGEPDAISVTGFRAYLENPLHFYLERRLRWRVPESLPHEMDALGFGNLAHSVLEAFNRSEAGRSLRSEKEIEEFLRTELEHTVSASFGARLSLPVRIQVNSLHERLRAAVSGLSGSRQEGWRPFKVEWSWMEEFSFMVEDVAVRGKIDLIEYNESDELYRIVDYKTSDKGVSPDKSHLARMNARSRAPLVGESVFVDGKATFQWKDLQLPLYQLAVEKSLGIKASCAYFNLSRTLNEVGLREYQFSDSQLAAAMTCARAVVRNIREGNFEPVDNPRERDSWLSWFGYDYNGTLDAPVKCGTEGGIP